MERADMVKRIDEVSELFWSQVDIGSEDECWPWTGKTVPDGYGDFRVGRGGERFYYGPHRYAYELEVGEIPDGLVLDHLCHNRDESCEGGIDCPHRLCANPSHLEPVTNAENIRRGNTGAWEAQKTHCKHGHPYNDENTYIVTDANGNDHRHCRPCAARRTREWRARQRS